MRESTIAAVRAREVLDSKGRPTVEVDVITSDGVVGRAAAPCGVSVGRHEAHVLRDGSQRLGGLGVLKAVQNVTEVIGPELCGTSAFQQRAIDRMMIALDGTPDKSRLGGNAIYSVSLAVAQAAAQSAGLPLYRYLGGAQADRLPMPMFNLINGGHYGEVTAEFQEFLLVPVSAETFRQAVTMGVEIFQQLEATIAGRFGTEAVTQGKYAGFGAPTDDPAAIIETLLAASDAAGYGGECWVALDCAASHFYEAERDAYRWRGAYVDREGLLDELHALVEAYNLLLIEDPLHEDDWEGYVQATERLDTLIVGDDFFVTNVERVRRGVETGAGDGLVYKPNQVGTLSEAWETARYAQAHGHCLVPSGRAGGSVDDPIPDIAVAVGAALIKCGAPRTGERTAGQNRLLRVEEELGASATFATLESWL